LFDRIKTINQTDAECTIIKNVLKRNEKNWNEMLLKHFKNVKNTLFYRDKLWISDLNELKLNVIRKMHDQSTVNHSDIRRTYEFVKRLYYWSGMKNFIDRYVRNCHTCKRSKAFRNRYAELLNSFSISNKSWTNIMMNFVIELFVNHEFNAILMIVDKFTKMHHYISCTIIDEDITIEKTARLLIDHVWKLHELFKYYCIRSRISICVIRMKNRVSHFANQRKTFNRISFWDEWTKRDRQSKNETLFTQLLQLSARRLIEVIIDDRVRFKCHYICVHRVIRLFNKLWIRIKNELW
jgi:hypothetical protein